MMNNSSPTSWAHYAIQKLTTGEPATLRPKGNSMVGIIPSGATVGLTPLNNDTVLTLGLVVLCKVKGHIYLHLIKGIEGERVLIGNNKGRINGWTHRTSIYGVATHVDGKPLRS